MPLTSTSKKYFYSVWKNKQFTDSIIKFLLRKVFGSDNNTFGFYSVHNNFLLK